MTDQDIMDMGYDLEMAKIKIKELERENKDHKKEMIALLDRVKFEAFKVSNDELVDGKSEITILELHAVLETLKAELEDKRWGIDMVISIYLFIASMIIWILSGISLSNHINNKLNEDGEYRLLFTNTVIIKKLTHKKDK